MIFNKFIHYLNLSDKQALFRIVNFEKNIYFIESIYYKLRLGVDSMNELIFFHKDVYNYKNQTIIMWEFNNENYIIKNIFNQKLIEINNNNYFQCINNIESYNFNKNYNFPKQFLFAFKKFYKEFIPNNKYLNIVKKEPIDIIIKYIDLSDISLKRDNIKQISKDKDNEELKYSLRSILQYIPWIRKIFILMPNKRVRYLKDLDYISDKVQYINDKEFLGYDSANIHAFTFNLFKSKNFGVSENFIYMEDDFFIGNYIKKSNLFYYNQESKSVAPLMIQKYFSEMNVTDQYINYNKLYNLRDEIHPHSGNGWSISIYGTNLFFHQSYPDIKTIIQSTFTHCARVENRYEIEDMFKIIQKYKYINETLFSKERDILTLNMPQFENLYQLNVLKKPYIHIGTKYILVENLNNKYLNQTLFVINTAGNHEPFQRQFLLEKKILQRRYPFKTKYEIATNVVKKTFSKNIYFQALKGLIILIITKIYSFFF